MDANDLTLMGRVLTKEDAVQKNVQKLSKMKEEELFEKKKKVADKIELVENM